MLRCRKYLSQRAEEGFSLLEVVVAFAVVAIVLAVLLPELHTARSRATRATEMQKVLILAEGQIEALKLLPATSEPNQSGSLGPWLWRASLELAPAPRAALVRLRTIHLQVLNRQRGRVLLDVKTRHLVQAVPT